MAAQSRTSAFFAPASATISARRGWPSVSVPVCASSDPNEPRGHIGPLTVLAEYRRRGIGRRLMLQCCLHIDMLEATAWLEIHLKINAGFYRTLGFDLLSKKPVLGVPAWFMRRAPAGR